jgi:hypothetical protein
VSDRGDVRVGKREVIFFCGSIRRSERWAVDVGGPNQAGWNHLSHAKETRLLKYFLSVLFCLWELFWTVPFAFGDFLWRFVVACWKVGCRSSLPSDLGDHQLAFSEEGGPVVSAMTGWKPIVPSF